MSITSEDEAGENNFVHVNYGLRLSDVPIGLTPFILNLGNEAWTGRTGKTRRHCMCSSAIRKLTQIYLWKNMFLHKLVRLSVIAPRGDSALAQSSNHSLCQGTAKDVRRTFAETAAPARRWGARSDTWRTCLGYACQHLANTQAKQRQEPLREKAEKGNSGSLSHQQVREQDSEKEPCWENKR